MKATFDSLKEKTLHGIEALTSRVKKKPKTIISSNQEDKDLVEKDLVEKHKTLSKINQTERKIFDDYDSRSIPDKSESSSIFKPVEKNETKESPIISQDVESIKCYTEDKSNQDLLETCLDIVSDKI